MKRHNDVVLLKQINIGEIWEVILKIKPAKDEAVVILIAENSEIDIDDLIAFLNDKSIIFLGGVFPGVIYQNQRFNEGALLFTLPIAGRPQIIKDIDTCNFREDIKELETYIVETDEKLTVLIFLDGLTSSNSRFIRGIHNYLGNSVNYFGGGAGSLTLTPKPCVFSNDGFFQHAAVIALVKMQSHLGVQHGWQEFKGPIVATKTIMNKVIELNWQNAFQIYKQALIDDIYEELNEQNFFEIAKGYPFGMIKENSEYIVRDPLAVNEKGELICIGEVPENSVLVILKGSKETLVKAAAKAVDGCLKVDLSENKKVFIVDCISRVLYLEDNFQNELDVIHSSIHSLNKELTPFGILSLGEISSYGNDLIEFFNKTIVVGVLYE